MSDLYGMGNTINMNNNGGINPEDKKKKIIIFGGIAAIGVIIILMIIVGVISANNNAKNNLIIDGLKTKLDSSIFYIGEDNVPYVCVENIAPKLSYEFYNGEYRTGSEDRTYCYVKNSYELATMQMDSNVIYKTLLSDDSSTFDSYRMSYKVQRINDKLYISLQTMQKVFNVKYTYDSTKNNLSIETLNSLYQKYNKAVKDAGYYEMSNDFSNLKALIGDMIVVINKDMQMGVLNLDGTDLIGTKYPNLTYSEGMDEFIVESNQKYGVLVKNPQGSVDVKVGFEYDGLKIIDNTLGLYLAKISEKYGVLDKTGKILIDLEYDRIGIENPSLFPTDNIKNSYVLYGNCIPVKQGDKWGLFDVTGKSLLTDLYGFGCIASTSQTSQNVLLIPASEGVEGIVVSRKNSINKVKYGIVDAQQALYRVPDSFDSIYKTTSGGKTEYNLLFGNIVIPIRDKLIDNSQSGSNSGNVQID